MKIRMDLQEYQSGRTVMRRMEPVASAESPQRNADVSSIHTDTGVRTRLEQEKIIGEALAIAQMSQALLQKALEISGRLRIIASQAITSGSVDTRELSLAISDVNSSFASHGERIVAPAALSPMAGTHPASEFQALRQIGQDIQEGHIPGKDRFDELDRALMLKSVETGSVMDEAVRSLENLLPAGQGDKMNRLDDVLSDTQRRMVENPSRGLASQNLLRAESVLRLVG